MMISCIPKYQYTHQSTKQHQSNTKYNQWPSDYDQQRNILMTFSQQTMYKKWLIIFVILGSIALFWCAKENGPRRLPIPNPDGTWPIINTDGTGMPLPPPPPQWPNDLSWPMAATMRRKIDDACLSGIMQTGSSFFQEVTKNTANKLEKLTFIKNKLESIDTDASETSKKQIEEQLKIINTLIDDINLHKEAIKKNPNEICQKNAENLKSMNKNMKEKILGLSWTINTVREHERREWLFEKVKEAIFPEESWEDLK